MSSSVIQVEGLAKQYMLGVKPADSLRGRIAETLARFHRSGHEQKGQSFWALKDVSFQVRQGDVLGVIGRNGAGKSTLLKILSRIVEPTEGRVAVYGRIGSLLEVGTGFHPELTGRENIYLNGAVLGMRRAEIDRKFDEIVAFAEVERFLDTPVKRYSSGMYVRLAFAVAAHLEPEILIVDEVLAVGDIAFQKKCLGKMHSVAGEGRTVLFVSHNMGVLRQICSSALWLDNGRVVSFGDTENILAKYIASGESASDGEYYHRNSNSSGPVRLRRMAVRNTAGEITGSVRIDQGFVIEIEYEITRPLDDVRVGYRLSSADGIIVFSSTDTDPEGTGVPRVAGIHISRCHIPPHLLNAGEFYVTATCDMPMREVLFYVENALAFHVDLMGGVGTSLDDARLGALRPSLDWDRINTEQHTTIES